MSFLCEFPMLRFLQLSKVSSGCPFARPKDATSYRLIEAQSGNVVLDTVLDMVVGTPVAPNFYSFLWHFPL